MTATTGKYPVKRESQGQNQAIIPFHVKHAKDPALQAAEEIAARLRIALRHHALNTDEDLSWSELGRRVWRRLGLTSAVDTSKISRIKLGQQLATVVEYGAFADELGVMRGWLVYNEGEMAISRLGQPAGADDGDEPDVPMRPRGKPLPPVTPRENPRRRKPPKQA
jgi:hypothetical protein